MPHHRINWPPPAGRWALSVPEVHVYGAELDPSPAQMTALASTLSLDERTRAERFHFSRHRDRFIAARAFLRAILGRYLQVEPARLEFVYSSRGKPALAAGFDGELHFNTAHSGDLALFAVTRAGPVGVDVERIRSMPDAGQIAARFFSPRESDRLQATPDADKPAAFFNLWTRKEAWLKATGEGIASRLSQVEVTFASGEPARLIAVGGDAQAAREWSLRELKPAEGFAAALAVRAKRVKVRCWRWPE